MCHSKSTLGHFLLFKCAIDKIQLYCVSIDPIPIPRLVSISGSVRPPILYMSMLIIKTAFPHPISRNVCQCRGGISASSGQVVRERDWCRCVFSVRGGVGRELHHHPQHVGPTT